MMKRKTDPVWNTIQFVQNYVVPRRQNFELITVQFEWTRYKWRRNWDRARIEMLYLNGDISKASEDYIPLVGLLFCISQGKRRRVREIAQYEG
jgi:hypothetical protein